MTVVDDEELVAVGKVANKKTVAVEDDVAVNGPVKMPKTAVYQVPQPEEFGTHDFMADDELEALASQLILAHKNLSHLNGRLVKYFWKKKGGQSGNSATLGKCLKPSGLLYEISDADFIIWLAADHLAGRTKHEVEATLFHELCHAGQNDEGNRVLVGHDVQEFRIVLERYGATTANLRAFVKTARQLSFADAD